MSTFRRTMEKMKTLPGWMWEQAFTRIEDLEKDSEGTLRYAMEEVDPSEGNLITARVSADIAPNSADPWQVHGGFHQDKMRILLDIDYPVYVRETSPGKFHVAFEKVVTRAQHNSIMAVLLDAGIIERGFAESAMASDLGACLRPPWVSKEQEREAKGYAPMSPRGDL